MSIWMGLKINTDSVNPRVTFLALAIGSLNHLRPLDSLPVSKGDGGSHLEVVGQWGKSSGGGGHMEDSGSRN